MKYVYIHNRGFGDYIINRYCRNFFSDIVGVDYISQYLIPLSHALDNDYNSFRQLEFSAKTPAFFNLKNSSFIEILDSLIQLRRTLRLISFENLECSIFLDRKRKFQDFFLGSNTVTPRELSNVYLSHIEFYQNAGHKKIKMLNEVNTIKRKGMIRIFPYSSNVRKDLSPTHLRQLSLALTVLNQEHEIIYMTGDKIADTNVPHSFIEKSFSALIDVIQKSKSVISCDSLPGHLSNFIGTPIFSILPSSNKYWLPYASYMNDWFLTFEEMKDIRKELLYKKLKVFV